MPKIPRVACVSDLHENLIDIPPCDLLLIAGDISYAFKGDLATKQRFLLGPFKDWYKEVPAADVVVVAGNHDQSIEQWGWPADLAEFEHLHYLQDEGIELHGLRLWGTPWQPWFYSWAFNAPRLGGEEFLAERFGLIPDDTDIVICHGPPKNLGDGVGSERPGQPHVGSTALLSALRRVQPRLAVVGHIHSGHGHYRLAVDDPTDYWEGTPPRVVDVVNAAIVDENYRAVNAPIVLDL